MDREKPRKGLGRSISIKSVKNVTKVVKNATKATIDKIGDKAGVRFWFYSYIYFKAFTKKVF